MSKLLLCAAVAIPLALIATMSSCGDGTGVCTGCCGPSGNTYCKDDWTEDECADWDQQQINGVSWNFHGGQTCAERGTPATP